MRNSPIPLLTRLVTILIILLFQGCAQDTAFTLTFEVLVGGQPLEFGKNYPSPNGDGTYSISDFKLYVSNIILTRSNPENKYMEKDSYHLLTFQDQNICSFVLNEVPSGSFENLHISIGVDEAGNFSKGYPGDLDPTNQMAWNWTQGYKFLLFEGLYKPGSSDEEIALVYHIGFNENRKDLEFRIPDSRDLHFSLEINELFTNPQQIDFHNYPRILFNPEQSAMLSQNYEDSFMRIL